MQQAWPDRLRPSTPTKMQCSTAHGDRSLQLPSLDALHTPVQTTSPGYLTIKLQHVATTVGDKQLASSSGRLQANFK
jgi:hypothetical protein